MARTADDVLTMNALVAAKILGNLSTQKLACTERPCNERPALGVSGMQRAPEQDDRRAELHAAVERADRRVEQQKASDQRERREQEERQAERRLARRATLIEEIGAQMKAKEDRLPRCLNCGVAVSRRLLTPHSLLCMACELEVSSGSIPSTWVKLLDTDVPLSAFRQMGLNGWHCSPEDLAFAQSLRKVPHAGLCLGALEDDWGGESPRAATVNGTAWALLEDMEEGGSDFASEVDFELLQEDVEDFMDSYGRDEDLERLMTALGAARGSSADVWVTADLAAWVDDQLDAHSIVNAWNAW